MNLRLIPLRFFFPAFIKKRKLSELFITAAGVFKADMQNIEGLSHQELLGVFALFTEAQVQRATERGADLDGIKKELYERARDLGRKIREDFRIRRFEDVLEACRILYRILGIDFRGDNRGEIIIRTCYFSKVYSPQTCRIMSAMDEGVVAGLSNGAILTFSQRITEDKPCCLARIEFGEFSP